MTYSSAEVSGLNWAAAVVPPAALDCEDMGRSSETATSATAETEFAGDGGCTAQPASHPNATNRKRQACQRAERLSPGLRFISTPYPALTITARVLVCERVSQAAVEPDRI